MRLLGFICISLLALVSTLAFAREVLERDWTGVVSMLVMLAVLVLSAFILWRGAKLERGAGQVKLSAGWRGESAGVFFSKVVFKSAQGRVLIAGSVISILVAVIALVWPDAIGIQSSERGLYSFVLGVWLYMVFLTWVRFFGPRYEAGVAGVLGVLAMFAIPLFLLFFVYA